MKKGSGILLHISSLPGKYGIGSFGNEARRFVKYLFLAGQSYWQILPLNPTGYKDSPYQSCASFALNPYFIDLDLLRKKQYLTKEEIEEHTKKSGNQIDFGYLYNHRNPLLRIAAFRAFHAERPQILRYLKKEKRWLEDTALFMMLKDKNQQKPWYQWEVKEEQNHDKKYLEQYKNEHFDEFYTYVTIQYLAEQQYRKLKKYANKKGIKIIGDLPIYVSLDSCDVWANKKEFLMDRRNEPTLVAGVPPDYFSENGQLWGNPIYNYERMKKNHFRFFTRRFKRASSLYDVIRVDHFRGFSSYWGVPAHSETAKNGAWYVGPGKDLIDQIKTIKNVEIIAEDLGDLSKDVYDLMEYSNFPGLKIVLFGLGGDWNHPYLPENYIENCVGYIGTHDNETMKAYIAQHENQWPWMRDYFHVETKEEVLPVAVQKLFASQANVVLLRMQDLLDFGDEARLNTPGTEEGNWTHRFSKKDFKRETAIQLYHWTKENGR